MFCASCGEEISDQAAYCPQCGAKVERDSESELKTDSDPAPMPVKPKAPKHSLLIVGIVAAVVLVGVSAFFAVKALTYEEPVLRLSEVADEAFRGYLSSNVDADQNGEISQEEADAVTAIGAVGEDGSASGGLASAGVSSLSGIEVFQNLEVLVCPSNSLTSVDVSNNAQLKVLICTNNQISRINLGEGKALERLDIHENQLASLDVSSCEGLTDLDCSSNQIASLELPGGETLKTVDARNNALVEVDLAGCTDAASILLDATTEFVGNAVDPEQATQDMLAELAMCYVVAADDTSGETAIADVAPAIGQDAELDALLVWNAACPDAYGQRLGQSGEEVETVLGREFVLSNGTYFIVDSEASQLLGSFYGVDSPDLSHLEGASKLLKKSGTGWALTPADGPISTTAWVANFKVGGDLVAYDLALGYSSGLGDHYIHFYHVTARRSEQSLYGYSLVYLTSYEGEAEDFDGLVAWSVQAAADTIKTETENPGSTDADFAAAGDPYGTWTEPSGTLKIIVNADGTCEYYNGAKYTTGTWSRQGEGLLSMELEGFGHVSYDFTFSGGSATYVAPDAETLVQFSRAS